MLRKGDTMLELIDISFERDGKKILDNINLKLEPKKFYVITGPNGSGKSTLAKIIMGIEKPDKGKILLNGVDITDKSINERAKLGIGFAFQQPVHFKGITVNDLLKIAANKKTDKEKICGLLSKVGLCAREYINREINSSLSGGELKRIEIASIIAKNPFVSIFDEPEAGIDLWSFRNLIEIFKQMESSSKGITIVISHQEKILKIADQIILMEGGKIKTIGNKDIMLNQILDKSISCSKGACCI